MEDVIGTINKLQVVFNATGYKKVDLPQVVVVGSQSSGKSSVLEHLVGNSFLPRGTGIVTRCPLLLQLTKSITDEYAFFLHDSSKTFTEYPLICEEIQNQTEKLAGTNKGICNTPITLKMFSPNHLDLTLVDLPGLTKVPVGDQPEDIDDQIRSLVMEYITKPNCIILAVIPANADMATSESLKLSRDVDPEGKRTLAVVTKLDLMDEGTDAMEMLSGNIIPVKLGIIGVVNRSQKDIIENKSIDTSLDDEAAFFQKNYKDIASYHGTPYLKKSVQKILIKHITTCLPELKETVSEQLAEKREKLFVLGESPLDKPSQILYLITKFSKNYVSTIKGNVQNIATDEIFGGARINYVFQDTLYNALEAIHALGDLPKSAILTAVQNASGATPALFVPDCAFELLVKKQIKKLCIPSLKCVDLINEELKKIVEYCLHDEELGLKRYPKLQHKVFEVVIDLLKKRIPVANKIVRDFIDVQLAYINTSHPDFIPNTNITLVQGQNSKKKLSFIEYLHDIQQKNYSNYVEKSESDYILIKELVQSYFSIVKKTIQDTIPKLIMHFMVNYVMENLQAELVKTLYGSEKAADLLEESPQVLGKRAGLQKDIATLEEAEKVLHSINSSQC